MRPSSPMGLAATFLMERATSLSVWWRMVPCTKGPRSSGLGIRRSSRKYVPSTSSIDGGGTVTITGNGFHAHGIYECRFGDTSVKARRLDDTQLLCEVPSYDVPETVYLSVVDAEARDHSSESIAFVYTERPHISLLIPDKAPVSGGVEILVHGRGFSAGLTCVFGELTSPSRFLSEELISCVAPASSRSGPVQLTLKDKDTTKASTAFLRMSMMWKSTHNDTESRRTHGRDAPHNQRKRIREHDATRLPLREFTDQRPIHQGR